MSQQLIDIVDFTTLKPTIEQPSEEQILEQEKANNYVIMEEYSIEKKTRKPDRFLIQYANLDDMVIVSPEIMKTLSKHKVKVDDIPSILKEAYPNAKDFVYNKNYNLFGYIGSALLGAIIVTLLMISSIFIPSTSEILVSEDVLTKPLIELTDIDTGRNAEVKGDNITNLGEEYTYTTGRRFKTTNYAYNNYSLCQIEGSQDTYLTRTKIDDPKEVDGSLELYNKCDITGPISKVEIFGAPSDESDLISLNSINNEDIIGFNLTINELNYPKFMIEKTKTPITQKDIDLRSNLVIFGNSMLLIAFIIEGVKVLKDKKRLKKAIIKG